MNGQKLNVPVAYYRVRICGLADSVQAKSLNAEIQAEKGSERGAVRSVVSVIPKIWAKPITSVGSKISNLFKSKGIQLGEGYYAIPLSVLPKFKAELDALKQERKLLVASLVEKAESGELQNQVLLEAGQVKEDAIGKIPSAEEIRDGFDVVTLVDVNFGDSKVEAAMRILSDEMKSQLRDEVEASTKKAQEEIMTNMKSKVTDKVKALLADIQDRVAKGEKGTQWKTLVDKVKHIVEVLPSYNVTENPELDRMIQSVRENFGTLNEDGLKESKKVREETVTKAQVMAQSFANLF